MKISKTQLEQAIKEEIEKIDLEEIDLPFSSQAKMQSAVDELEWPEIQKQLLASLVETSRGWLEEHDAGNVKLSPWVYAQLEKQVHGGPRGQLVLALDDPHAEPEATSFRSAVDTAHRRMGSPGSGAEKQVAEDLQKLVKEELVDILKNK
jgi:hypothetical protein